MGTKFVVVNINCFVFLACLLTFRICAFKKKKKNQSNRILDKCSRQSHILDLKNRKTVSHLNNFTYQKAEKLPIKKTRYNLFLIANFCLYLGKNKTKQNKT